LGTDTPASGKKNPMAEHVVTNVYKSQLKIDMPIILSGGLKHARDVLNPEIIMDAYVKTGAAQALGPSFQQRAIRCLALLQKRGPKCLKLGPHTQTDRGTCPGVGL
jgi:SpoU rRNA methylase family enzyme